MGYKTVYHHGFGIKATDTHCEDVMISYVSLYNGSS